MAQQLLNKASHPHPHGATGVLQRNVTDFLDKQALKASRPTSTSAGFDASAKYEKIATALAGNVPFSSMPLSLRVFWQELNPQQRRGFLDKLRDMNRPKNQRFYHTRASNLGFLI
jgi:hypothetical protein